MLWLLMWVLYGFFVGLIAKALHPGEDPVGFIPTIIIGIIGSFMGGFINFIIGRGDPFAPSGILMGIVGGVICCYLYSRFHLGRYLEVKKLKDEVTMLKAQNVEEKKDD